MNQYLFPSRLVSFCKIKVDNTSSKQWSLSKRVAETAKRLLNWRVWDPWKILRLPSLSYQRQHYSLSRSIRSIILSTYLHTSKSKYLCRGREVRYLLLLTLSSWILRAELQCLLYHSCSNCPKSHSIFPTQTQQQQIQMMLSILYKAQHFHTTWGRNRNVISSSSSSS